MKKKKEINWKIIAILFIALFVISLLYLSVNLYFDLKIKAKEEKCTFDVCDFNEQGESIAYDYHFFDSKTNMCLCFENNRIVHKKQIV